MLSARDVATELKPLAPTDLDLVPLSLFSNGLGPDPMGCSLVYFVGCGQHVKIGQTCDLPRRLNALRGSNPMELTLLLVARGTFETERLLHTVFLDHRERGEWFRHEGALAVFLEKAPQ